MSCIINTLFTQVHSFDAGYFEDFRDKKTSDDERVDVTDLMSRLMKGDTLSDEDMLLLQRN